MAANKQLPTELRGHDYTEYDELPKTAQAKRDRFSVNVQKNK